MIDYHYFFLIGSVLVAAVSAQNEATGVLCFRLALVMALFVGVRLFIWWLERRESAE